MKIAGALGLLLLAVPASAQPSVTVPAPAIVTHTIDYTEPTTKADGTPLQGLVSIRLYWRVDDGPETMVTLPASSIKGGLERRFHLPLPPTGDILTVTVTAVDSTGNESVRTSPARKVIGPAGARR
jgi:hypothetical protein